MVLGSAIPATLATTSSTPVLLVTGFSLNPQSIVPGGTAVANVTVRTENNNSVFGSKVVFEPTGPISIIGTGTTFYIGDMNGSTAQSLLVAVGASPTTTSGSYPLPYMIEYSDSSNKTYSSTGQISIPVSGTPVRPQLVVSAIEFSPTIIAPGITFATLINVTNSGSATAFGSVLTLTPGASLTLSGSTGIVSLSELQANKSLAVVVKMNSDPKAPTKSVLVQCSFTYSDKAGIQYSSNSSFAVQITSTPDLKVGAFTLSSAPLRPGSTGFLGLTMINVGGDTAFDVKMVFSGPFFLGGSSVNYLGAISSGGSAPASFFYSVSNSTSYGTYNLNLVVTYVDLIGKTYTVDSNYSVAVAQYQPPSVSVTNTILDPPVLSPGTSGTLTIFLKNTGTTEATNVQVQISGGKGLVSTEYFGLGTVEPGTQVTQVVGVNVDSKLHPGNYSLSFDVSYSDLTGKVYHTSIPLQYTVYEGANPFSLFNIAIVAGLVLVAIVFIAVLRKIKVI